MGGNGDGGYLIPNLMNEIDHCFSPGVSDIADFEKELIEKYDINCFLADASVNSPPFLNKKIEFVKKFIKFPADENSITFENWVHSSSAKNSKSLLLQMDIEGFEYSIIYNEKESLLNQFKIMVIEFHFLDKMSDPKFANYVFMIFKKILKHFRIVHLHPNNCCGIAKIDGLDVPRVLEATFVRTDVAQKITILKPEKSFPHELDYKNVGSNPDITLPQCWYK